MKRRTPNRRRHIWTPDDVLVLKTLYADNLAANIALIIGCTVQAVWRKANKLGLEKSAEFNTSAFSGRLKGVSGIQGRFKKGFTPWNKGMKGLCFPGGVATQFQPGHRGGRAAEIYQPIGTERISKDGYIQRKVNDDMPFQQRWRGVHLINWEAINGPLPAGHALVFRDGDKLNCDPENLELVTRAELMRRNTIHNLPPAIKEVIHIKKSLTRLINRKEKEHEPNNR